MLFLYKTVRNLPLLALVLVIGATAYLAYSVIDKNEIARNAVFRIVSPSEHKHGGTGFQVKTEHGRLYSLTNRHVCDAAENGLMHAMVGDSERFYPVRIILLSDNTDLCLLEPVPLLEGIALGDLKIGDPIRVIGHPRLLPRTEALGYAISLFTLKLIYKLNPLPGECSSSYMHEELVTDELLQLFGVNIACVAEIKSVYTNARIFPGNSGSPVLNMAGELVGVAFAADDAGAAAFFIPSADVKKFLELF